VAILGKGGGGVTRKSTTYLAILFLKFSKKTSEDGGEGKEIQTILKLGWSAGDLAGCRWGKGKEGRSTRTSPRRGGE